MKTYKDLKIFTENTETLNFIKRAHFGQKYGSEPYWKHPKAVADKGKELFGSKFSKDEYTVALLHDVVEDTEYSLEKLKDMGYPKAVLDAVSLVTKDKTLSYEENINKIISSGNRLAMMVKFADNWMNYHGDKSGWSPEKREKSQAKYKRSMEAIGKKLGIKVDL